MSDDRIGRLAERVAYIEGRLAERQAMDDEQEPRIVIGIVGKWPYRWSDCGWFICHPIEGYRVVRLYTLVKLLRWVQR